MAAPDGDLDSPNRMHPPKKPHTQKWLHLAAPRILRYGCIRQRTPYSEMAAPGTAPHTQKRLSTPNNPKWLHPPAPLILRNGFTLQRLTLLNGCTHQHSHTPK
jgi:hypothetical protein